MKPRPLPARGRSGWERFGSALGNAAAQPIRKRVIVGWLLVGFAGAPGAKGVQIAWAAHVGGFVAGLALLPLFAARQSGPRVRP